MAKETLESVKKELAEAQVLIAELNKKLSASEKGGVAGKKVVVIGKKEYEVVTPSFNLNSENHKAEELETNDALAKEVLAIEGQNIVKLLEK